MHDTAPIAAESLPQPRIPGRGDALWFAFRAMCFRVRRAMRNAFDRGHRRHYPGAMLQDAPVIAESVSPLWPAADAPERALAIGKIENLRIARRAFDGVVLKRGEVMSFWAQLGRASRSRGYVTGRELREGCLIPSIGGGLCQLSNALYDAALKAGLEIVERHAHSQVVPGSAAARGRDATVFWNYVDLRIRAPFDIRLQVELDAEALRVYVRGVDAHARAALHVPVAPLPARSSQATAAQHAGDCATCGQTHCFRNAPHAADALRSAGEVAILCDAPMPEHAAFLHELEDAQWLRAPTSLWWRWRQRVVTLRHRLRRSPPAQRAMALSALAAEAVASRLRPRHVELYVDQAWLPFLWRRGALAGRRFHVLMRALPMARIHAELEIAVARHPEQPTLRDFRADAAVLRAEDEALRAAERWIGPHAGAMTCAGTRALPLPWRLPQAAAPRAPRKPGPLRVLFPASSLVRKGVLELSMALCGTDAEVILPARDGGEPSRWGAIPLRRIAAHDEALSQCDVVVLPAWVEHQPRALLAAIAQGVPVIATPACGLGGLPGWIAVPAGDVDALRAALQGIGITPDPG